MDYGTMVLWDYGTMGLWDYGCFNKWYNFGKGGNIVSEANNEYPLLAAMPSRHRY